MQTDYLKKLLENAGLNGSERKEVSVPGWGKDGGIVKWHVEPLSGADELRIDAYVNRTAQVASIVQEKARDVLVKVSDSLKVDGEDEDGAKLNHRISMAHNIVLFTLSNQDAQDSARISATIYYSAKNAAGNLLFKPSGADTDPKDFEAIDELGRMPISMRRTAFNAIREHIVSPLQLASIKQETELMQEQLAAKSQATPAGESPQD